MVRLRSPLSGGWTSTSPSAVVAELSLTELAMLSGWPGDPNAFPLPAGTADRVRCGLERNLELIPMGITEDRIQLGSHLIYFWESDDDFKRGVKFLNRGLGQSDHCIVFGHDEAIERVLANLAADGFDTQRLISELQLTVLPRRKSAQHTLSDISDVVQAALQAGARAVRFLGNLGMGRAPSAS